MLVKTHPYQFVFYFVGDHEFINHDTGEVVKKGNSYRGSPYENKGLNTVFKFITQIMKSERKVLGSQYSIDDQIPQKLKIFHNNQCIVTIPEAEGETITNIHKDKEMLVNALNEWERFKMRFIRNNGNVKAIEEVQQPKNDKETELQRLNEERRIVFSKLSDYSSKLLGYELKKSTNIHLYEKIVMLLKSRIKDIPNYYTELQELIDKEVQEKEVFEPLVFSQNQTAVAELTHTEWIESYIEILSNEYEKTSRKATKTVKKTFESAFSRCKDVSKLNAVFDNYLTEIKEGRF